MKRGFTLIELLAVIVILAIIALIATPIVLNIIKDSKESASLRSADFYLDAVEFSIANSTLDNKNIADGAYPIMQDGNICLGELINNKCDKDILKVEVKGEKPSSGTITITNEEISEINISLNDKTIVKNDKGELIFSNDNNQDSDTLAACTYQDLDESGNINLSDIVTCGTESFYVMFNENSVVTMMSVYPINVGAYQLSEKQGIQNDDVLVSCRQYHQNNPEYHCVIYSGAVEGLDCYWTTDDAYDQYGYYKPLPQYEDIEYPYVYDSGATLIYQYIEEYLDYLEENSGLKATGKLISMSQLGNLGCNGVSCTNAPNWIKTCKQCITGNVDTGFGGTMVLIDSSIEGQPPVGYEPYGGYAVKPVIQVSEHTIQK